MNQGTERVKCPRCGENNFTKSAVCWRCGEPLKRMWSPATPPKPEQPPPSLPVTVNPPPGQPPQSPPPQGSTSLTQDTRKATKGAAIEGIALGCIAGPMLGIWPFLIGLVLTLTGIGAIIGIPLMIAGVLIAIISPLLTAAGIKGPCPHCGHAGIFATAIEIAQGGIDCPACKRRILIRDRQFWVQ